jgi:hypothetical protein
VEAIFGLLAERGYQFKTLNQVTRKG